MPLRPGPAPSAPARKRPDAARAALLAVVGLLVALLSGLAAPASAAGLPAATDPADDGDRPLVVLAGTAGVRWNGLNEADTPNLWAFGQEAALAENAVRSVRRLACPADGWLAVSAGKRAADSIGEDGRCRTLVDPAPGGAVPGWDDYLAEAEEGTYGARPGTLGEAVRAGGRAVAGIGPGAAIALAGADGVPVGEHVAEPSTPAELRAAVSGLAPGVDLLVVDLGAVRDRGKATTLRPLGEPNGATTEQPTFLEQVRSVDGLFGALRAELAAVDRPVTLILASLADSGREPRLQATGVLGPALLPDAREYGATLLGTASTRQPGMIQATDLLPTLARGLGVSAHVPAGALVGAPVVALPPTGDAFAQVLDIGKHAIAIQPLVPPYFVALVAVNLIFYLIVAVGLNGWIVAALRTRAPISARRVLRFLTTAGVAIASIPVASFLANAFPWWRLPWTGAWLFGAMLAIVAAITALTLLPKWGHYPTTPIAVVAGLTMAVLAFEALTSGTLQMSALMGVLPTVAGRFYGMNNQAYALFATASVLVAAVAADPLIRAGRRRAAAAVIAGIGLVVTVLDGAPAFGADFGGPPSIVPAFLLFALMALGVRISFAKVVLVLAAGAVVVLGLAFADWLRPEEDRTHLGRFVQTALDGGLWDVISRKLDQNLAILGGSSLTLLALGGIALVVLVLMRPIRLVANAPDGGPYNWLSGGAPLRLLGERSPLLGSALTTLVVLMGLGFALNDSGIAIPAMGVSLAVPLLVAVSASWISEMRWRSEAEAEAATSGASREGPLEG